MFLILLIFLIPIIKSLTIHQVYFSSMSSLFPYFSSVFGLLFLAFLKVFSLAPIVILWSINLRKYIPSIVDIADTTSIIFCDFSACEPVPDTPAIYLRNKFTSQSVNSLSESSLHNFLARPPSANQRSMAACSCGETFFLRQQLWTTLVVMPIFTFLLMCVIRLSNSLRSPSERSLRKLLISFYFQRWLGSASILLKKSTVLQKLPCMATLLSKDFKEAQTVIIINYDLITKTTKQPHYSLQKSHIFPSLPNAPLKVLIVLWYLVTYIIY